MMPRALLVFCILGVALGARAQAPQLRLKYRPDAQMVDLAWTAVAGASYYTVHRATTYPTWDWATNIGNNTFMTVNVTPNSAFVYQVIGRNTSGVPIASSIPALVTTSTYAEAVNAGTPVRASHITELRTLANRARQAAGLPPFTWTFATRAANDLIQRADITDLRTAIDAALANIGQTPPAYTDPALAGSPTRKQHVNELRTRVMNHPELILATAASMTESYFSPNGDAVKDSTRIDVTFRVTTETSWRLNIRTPANAVVLTRTGVGGGFSFTWDGRDDAGVMRPDGTYYFDVLDGNGFPTIFTSLWSVVDNTAPGASIDAPAQSQLLSNVHGTAAVAVTGGATDANMAAWSLVRTGNAQPDATLASASISVQPTATLATFSTISGGTSLANGTYTLRLKAEDWAGNKTTTTRDVTVGNFTAELVGHEINTTATPTQTVRYTSKVPFTVNEVVTVRRHADHTVVRTLFSGTRSAGTYDDLWDGRNDAGVLLGDGQYELLTSATEGASTYIWDESNTSVGGGYTQYEYPTCRNEAGALVACDSSTVRFDPFTNKPLRINFCVGGGHVSTGCTGNTPALVIAKISGVTEDSGACDSNCIASFPAGSGPHEILWYGTNANGDYIAGSSTRLLVLRGQTYARNAVLLTGTRPRISVFKIQPMYFFNPNGPSGQSFVVDVVSPAGRPLSISAQFRNMASKSVLRTVTLPASTAARQTLTWDGRADNGAWVAPAMYEVTLTATDTVGGSATVKPIVAVRY